MQFREIIYIYCEKHTKDINTPCGENAEAFSVKAGSTYSALTDSIKTNGGFSCSLFTVSYKQENLRYDNVQSGRRLPTFHRNVLLPHSGLKSNLIQQRRALLAITTPRQDRGSHVLLRHIRSFITKQGGGSDATTPARSESLSGPLYLGRMCHKC